MPGHEALIIAAADTILEVSSAELAARYFPDVPIRGDLDGCQALLSIEKARRLLGYEPRYSWRDELKSEARARPQ